MNTKMDKFLSRKNPAQEASAGGNRADRTLGLLAAVSMMALPAGSPASAADAPAAPATASDTATLDAIVITGTQIRGTAAVGTTVSSLDKKDFVALGLVDASDILRTLPSVMNLGADPTHYTSNQRGILNTSFLTGINLRGVGTADTLVLVDGRRIAPAGASAGFVDPNVIPEAAIQRMDVEADGASAIYGSDAVGGVVNVILRKPFDGAETTVRYGGGVGEYQWTANQVLSKTWDNGGLFLDVEHRFQSNLLASDVSSYYTDNYNSHGGPNFGTASSSPGNILVGTTYYPLPANPAGAHLTSAQLRAGSPTLQGFYAGAIDAIPQTSRTGGIFDANQYVADHNVKLFAEGLYSRQDNVWNRAYGATGATSFNVPSTNPFYISGIPGIAPGAAETVKYSLLRDVGPDYNFGYEYSASGTLGATIDAGKGWQIEPTATFSEDAQLHTTTGIFNSCALGLYSGITLSGQKCAGTSALADSNPATAFDPFAPGTTNPATLARIAAQSIDRIKFDRFSAKVRADGPIYDLPAGSVRLGVGAEFSNDHMTHVQQRNDGTYTPDNTTAYTLSGAGSRRVASFYGELFLPVVSPANALPLVRSLTLSAAGRYENYSDFGSTSNPKFGVNWKPVDDLTIHASYGTSFRAPTLSEEAPNILGTATYQQQSFANALYPQLGATTVNALTTGGGNATLRPETASTESIGADYQPKAIPGLTLSLNYFNLDLKKQITSITVSSALTDPTLAPFVTLNPTAAQINAVCTASAYVSTSCTNIKAIINGQLQNLGVTQTNGLEFTSNYDLDTSLGRWNVGLIASDILNFKNSLVPGTPLVQRVNTVNYPLRVSGRLILGWHKDGWDVSTFVNYQNSYQNQTITPFQNVAAYETVDFTVTYGTSKNSALGLARDLVISLHVTNLFDKAPPYVEYLGSSTIQYFAFDPQNASALGRITSIELSKKF